MPLPHTRPYAYHQDQFCTKNSPIRVSLFHTRIASLPYAYHTRFTRSCVVLGQGCVSYAYSPPWVCLPYAYGLNPYAYHTQTDRKTVCQSLHSHQFVLTR